MYICLSHLLLVCVLYIPLFSIDFATVALFVLYCRHKVQAAAVTCVAADIDCQYCVTVTVCDWSWIYSAWHCFSDHSKQCTQFPAVLFVLVRYASGNFFRLSFFSPSTFGTKESCYSKKAIDPKNDPVTCRNVQRHPCRRKMRHEILRGREG